MSSDGMSSKGPMRIIVWHDGKRATSLLGGGPDNMAAYIREDIYNDVIRERNALEARLEALGIDTR